MTAATDRDHVGPAAAAGATLPAVLVDHLTVRIPTRVERRPAWVHAATDVSLALHSGRVRALVGESGCGKSVLASALVGLLPGGTQTSGRVVVAGTDVSASLGCPQAREWTRLRGRVVGFVPQSSATFLTPTRTVGSQLAEAVRWLQGPASPAELCDRVHLSREALARYPHELSGGMAGRAAVAFALAGKPKVIVADEPTASLDSALTSRILALLRESADAGVAVLLITHDVAALLATGVADELSVQYAGRIVDSGPADRLLTHPEVDYTRALVRALPQNGLHAVPGMPPALTDLDDRVRFSDRLAEVPQ